jgi:hypothetical protein
MRLFLLSAALIVAPLYRPAVAQSALPDVNAPPPSVLPALYRVRQPDHWQSARLIQSVRFLTQPRHDLVIKPESQEVPMLLMRSSKLRASLIRGSLAVLLLCGAMAGAAQARIFIGIGVPLFFPPVWVPPPVYYPPYYGPPMVYAPPGDTFNYTPPSAQPGNLAPPRGYAPSGGYTPSMGGPPVGGANLSSAQSCQAGAYVCPLVEDTPPGGPCSCPGHNGQRVRGRAD